MDQTHEGVRTVEPYSQGKEKITPITQQDNQVISSIIHWMCFEAEVVAVCD